MTENDNLTPKVPCSRCGVRYVEDLTKDERGRPIPEVDLPDFERLCEPCSVEVFSEGVSTRARLRVPLALEEFCGLTTADKETIKALISLVSNHDKVKS